MTPLNVLILGASYGSLLAKITMAGHNARMVCLPASDLFNVDGAVIRTPVGRDGLVEIRSTLLPGQLAAGGLMRLTRRF